jgi:hypothetical protein
MPSEVGFQSNAMPCFTLSEGALLIRLPGSQQVVYYASELVSGEVIALSVPSLARMPVIVTQVGLASMQRLGSHAQRHCRTIFNHAGSDRQNLTATDAVVGHSPNQEAKADALAKRDRSGPISANRTCTVSALSPGTSVKSTPQIRYT